MHLRSQAQALLSAGEMVPGEKHNSIGLPGEKLVQVECSVACLSPVMELLKVVKWMAQVPGQVVAGSPVAPVALVGLHSCRNEPGQMKGLALMYHFVQ